MFLKRILEMENNDPVFLLYKETLGYGSERNWANEVLGLRRNRHTTFPQIIKILRI